MKHPVFMAVMDTSRFYATTFRVQFYETCIDLPIWTDGEGTVVFSVRDAARHFSVDFRTVQDSEWLAIFTIPSHLIVRRVTL